MHCFAPSAAPRLLSPRYLTTVEGRCLNYLSSSHRRVDCRLPTRCFNYHELRHHLRDCKLSQKSPIALGDSEASRGTLQTLGDRCTSSELESSPSDASSFPEPDHIFFMFSMCSIPRSWDPMVEEATLSASVGAPCHSSLEEVVSMVEQLANPLPTTLSPCLSNLPPPVEDI
jgi:hypothetical protein